jgi:large subunit ribosomal protein L19
MANQIESKGLKFSVGDTVAVHQKVKEGGKERIQIFEGVVIAIRGRDSGKSFVVRKFSLGIGVERIWPVLCPFLTKIEVKKKGNVRRAKLYYLREHLGKTALKINQKKDEQKPATINQKTGAASKKAGSIRRKTGQETSSK